MCLKCKYCFVSLLEVYVLEGRKARIPCFPMSVQKTPINDPKYKWLMPNGAEMHDVRMTMSDVGDLVVSQLKHEESNIYSCTAQSKQQVSQVFTYNRTIIGKWLSV